MAGGAAVNPRVQSGWKRWGRAALQVISLLVFILILWAGGAEAWQQLVTADRSYLLLAFLFHGSVGMVAAARLRLVSQALSGRELASWRHFYHLNMTARALGLVLPRGISTLGGKSVGLRALGVSLRRAVWIVLADNGFDMAVLGSLAMVALFFLRGILTTGTFLLVAGGVLLVLVGGLWWITRPARNTLVWRWLRRFNRNEAPQGEGQAADGLLIPPFRPGLAAMALTVVYNGLLSVALYWMGQAVGLPFSWFLILACFLVSQLSLVIAVTPGGLGLLDAGWYGTLRFAGVPEQEALTFVIAQRAYLFIFVLLWAGVSALLAWFRR